MVFRPFARVKAARKKGTPMHRRLLLFFVSISVFLILSFSLLMILLGITGKEEKALKNYMIDELDSISSAVSEDFGHMAVDGINLAETIAGISDHYFAANGITAAELADNPQLIEGLLSAHSQTLLGTVSNRPCGGVFVLLDATIKPDAPGADNSKAGIFIKKTQPNSTQAVGVKLHYLRGPAQIARSNGIELLGQWRMEYNIEGQEFFTEVMKTARDNPELHISRLYYWSGRVVLKDNSEAGFLLCVPLRSSDGTVFGVCGIEVSDRMFKTLYSPEGNTYESLFTIASPAEGETLLTSRGIIAGNNYLTGTRIEEDLTYVETRDDFHKFAIGGRIYGGRSASLRLYPSGSPYEDKEWAVSLLMSEEKLTDVIRAHIPHFVLVVAGLILFSLIASFVISHHYLRPVIAAMDQKDSDHEKAMREISRLAYLRKQEVDPDNYQQFLASLSALTRSEREIFDLYIEGRSTQEILDALSIKENTLKYHNKNIYSKLGVTSRKELLRFAALMNHSDKE